VTEGPGASMIDYVYNVFFYYMEQTRKRIAPYNISGLAGQ